MIEETIDLINTDLKVKEPSFNSPRGSFSSLPLMQEKEIKLDRKVKKQMTSDETLKRSSENSRPEEQRDDLKIKA